MLWMGKLTIAMAIFHSFLYVYQAGYGWFTVHVSLQTNLKRTSLGNQAVSSCRFTVPPAVMCVGLLFSTNSLVRTTTNWSIAILCWKCPSSHFFGWSTPLEQVRGWLLLTFQYPINNYPLVIHRSCHSLGWKKWRRDYMGLLWFLIYLTYNWFM